ncbi:MAG: DUF1254 domain-containing protein, partial [Pseudolabrys sp.]
VRPNADTLYSLLWFDVSKEPLLISVPDSGVHRTCPLSGVKRTSRLATLMSAFDPEADIPITSTQDQLSEIQLLRNTL